MYTRNILLSTWKQVRFPRSSNNFWLIAGIFLYWYRCLLPWAGSAGFLFRAGCSLAFCRLFQQWCTCFCYKFPWSQELINLRTVPWGICEILDFEELPPRVHTRHSAGFKSCCRRHNTTSSCRASAVLCKESSTRDLFSDWVQICSKMHFKTILHYIMFLGFSESELFDSHFHLFCSISKATR